VLAGLELVIDRAKLYDPPPLKFKFKHVKGEQFNIVGLFMNFQVMLVLWHIHFSTNFYLLSIHFSIACKAMAVEPIKI
jgi:hypothetical protein